MPTPSSTTAVTPGPTRTPSGTPTDAPGRSPTPDSTLTPSSSPPPIAVPTVTWEEVDPAGTEFAGALVGKVIRGGPGLIAFGQDQQSLEPIVWTSADGLNWTREATPSDTFGGGVPDEAVQVGDVAIALGYRASLDGTTREIWLSTDGRTWTRDASATGRFGDVYLRLLESAGIALAYGGDGYRELVLRSADGAQWVAVPEFDTALGHQPGFSSVLADRGGFLALGVTGAGSSPVFHEWSSADGISWQGVPVEQATPGEIWPAGAYRTPFGLLLFGSTVDLNGTSVNAAWISDDGRYWRDYPIPPELTDLSVSAGQQLAGGELLVTTDWSGEVPKQGLVVSRDGRAWHGLDPPGPSDVVADWSQQSTAWAGGVLVFGYDPGARRMRGWLGHVQWEGVASASPTPVSPTAPAASPAPSPDGPASPIRLEWQSLLGPSVFGRPGDAGAITAATSFADGLVAVGSMRGHNTSWVSPDGIRWQRAPAQSTLDGITLTGVAARSDRVVAVGFSEEPTEAVAVISTDGLHWTRAPVTPALSEARMNAVTAGNEVFVAVGETTYGDSPLAWTSADGLTWTASSNVVRPAGRSMDAVTASGDAFIAGGFGDDTIQFWRSIDGTAWTPATASSDPDAGWHGPGTVTGMTVSGMRILAVGQFWRSGEPFEGAVFESSDAGRTWRRQPRNQLIADTNLSSITYAHGQYVIAGVEQFPSGGRARIFVSANGVDWVAADSVALNGPDPAPPALRSISALVPLADRVVAFGRSSDNASYDGLESESVAAVWLGSTDAALLPDHVCPTGDIGLSGLAAMTRADRVVCLGGQRLSFRAWYEVGGCARQSGFADMLDLACFFGGSLTFGPGQTFPSLDFRTADGVEAPADGWVTVVGWYDDPSSSECLDRASVSTGLVHFPPAVSQTYACRAQLFVEQMGRSLRP